jgi:RNA polymerase sigma-70 factor, ECF subfamily
VTSTIVAKVNAGEARVNDRCAARDEPLTRALLDLASGDLGALDEIWSLCADDLYGLALWRTGVREDAEDAVQDVFVRLVRSAGRAAAARRPHAYLLAMARRAAVDVRRRRRHVALDDAAALVVPASDPGARLDAQRVSGLVARLAPKLREAVFLRHFAELTFSDAAKVMGVPTFTAASRYRLALRRLRDWMGVEG